MSFGASLDGGRIEYALSDVGALFAQPRQCPVAGLPRGCFAISFGSTAAPRPRSARGRPSAGCVDGTRARRWLPEASTCGRSAARSGRCPRCGGRRASRRAARALLPQPRPARTERTAPVVDGQRRQPELRRPPRRTPGRGRGAHPNRRRRAAVVRDGTEVAVHLRRRRPEIFDQVVLACHSDEALRPPRRPTAAERTASRRDPLSPEPGRPASRRRSDAAAVAPAGRAGSTARERTPARDVAVTYWMNRLQNLPEDDPLFVTLNPTTPIPEALVYDETTFDHPVFDAGRSRRRPASRRSRARTAPGLRAPGCATASTRTASPARCGSPGPMNVPAW